MLKTIATCLTLGALTMAAVVTLPMISAQADSYGYGYRYNQGRQSYDYYWGKH